MISQHVLGAHIQVSNNSQDQCACMSQVLEEYESVHASRVITRALRLREYSRGFKHQNRAQPKLENSCTVLTLDEVRSEVPGVTDASAVTGHEEKKHLLKTLLSHRNNRELSLSCFCSWSGSESNQTVNLKCCDNLQFCQQSSTSCEISTLREGFGTPSNMKRCVIPLQLWKAKLEQGHASTLLPPEPHPHHHLSDRIH